MLGAALASNRSSDIVIVILVRRIRNRNSKSSKVTIVKVILDTQVCLITSES